MFQPVSVTENVRQPGGVSRGSDGSCKRSGRIPPVTTSSDHEPDHAGRRSLLSSAQRLGWRPTSLLKLPGVQRPLSIRDVCLSHIPVTSERRRADGTGAVSRAAVSGSRVLAGLSDYPRPPGEHREAEGLRGERGAFNTTRNRAPPPDGSVFTASRGCA
ncbi:hypothetical protein EYF80_054247 [Liparis tanakae]|uniref:Uncharacterized protein n=1 Tax=Liparis tanakae TaxID=230148 RepID=A0A4Z2F2Y2_9TELE|nr:hypothetical protein EYF80_054247 [Liparis tanakae]